MGQTLGVVSVVGTVDRRHDVLLARLDTGYRARVGEDGIAHLQAHVGHDVSDKNCTGGQPLIGQMSHGYLGRGQAQVCGVVGENSVVLLGHATVEGTQPGFQMGHRQVHLHRREGAGNGRIGVAVNEHPVWVHVLKHRIKLLEHPAGHDAVGAASYTKMQVRVRDPELDEEGIRHVDVVMLPGMDDLVVDPLGRESLSHRGQFHELGTSPDDTHDAHDAILSMR